MWVKTLLVLASATINLLVPMEYQGVPKHPVPVIFVSTGEIDLYCGKSRPGFHTLACEKGGTLVMPNPCEYPEYKDPYSYARLLCHEKGHVLGWHHIDE